MEDFDLRALTWDDDPRRIERAKAVADEIVKRVPDLAGMVGLDFGCGTGLLSFCLHPYLKEITLVDTSEGMLAVVQRKIVEHSAANMHALNVDLSSDGVLEGRFNLIYSLMALHHVPALDKVLAALANALTPSGYLCIADLDEEDGSFHGNDFAGHHGFNRAQLALKLAELGLSDITSETVFEVKRQGADGRETAFPVFLMTARKALTEGMA